MSEVKAIDDEIKFWVLLYDSNKNNPQQAEALWSKAIELLPTYVASLSEVVIILEKNKEAMKSLINTIKAQLKTY